MLRTKETLRQVHHILFPRLTDGCGTQQITYLFLE
jgi:hypothetical protein